MQGIITHSLTVRVHSTEKIVVEQFQGDTATVTKPSDQHSWPRLGRGYLPVTASKVYELAGLD